MPDERTMLKRVLQSDDPALNIIYLDEIAGLLEEISDTLRSKSPDGLVEPIEGYQVTSVRKRINPVKPWRSFTLTNDGPNSIFIIVNTAKSFDEHEVQSGEKYEVDMHHAIIVDLLLWCNPGETASARVVGVR